MLMLTVLSEKPRITVCHDNAVLSGSVFLMLTIRRKILDDV